MLYNIVMDMFVALSDPTRRAIFQQTRQRWEERFEALDRVLEAEKQKLAQAEQEKD
jgi:hypothetical protein